MNIFNINNRLQKRISGKLRKSIVKSSSKTNVLTIGKKAFVNKTSICLRGENNSIFIDDGSILKKIAKCLNWEQ